MINPIRSYLQEAVATVGLIKPDEVAGAVTLLQQARRRERGVYICGNGGSASTASHMAADFGKNIRTHVGHPMHVVALTDNVAWMTALANDESYADCFAGQLRNLLRPDDLVIGVSASGESENVIRAFEFAARRRAHRLALVGFDGGRLARMATRRVWIDSYDYGLVESMHLLVAHLLVKLLSIESPTMSRAAAAVEPAAGRTAMGVAAADTGHDEEQDYAASVVREWEAAVRE
jgi:D-sedoheptulose 7-phosphate isomerase